jgi:cell division protein FtsN
MQQKQRVFIYDRKEMGVLTLLGVMVAVFAFTLGVHLGKKVAAQPKGTGVVGEAAPVATLNDQVPEPREIHENAKGVEQTADETLSQSLKEEVGQVGVKTEKTMQVDLPKQPKTQNAGATTLQESADDQETPPQAQAPATEQPKMAGRYSLQIGSYPVLADAKARIEEIAKSGLKPYLKEAEIQGRGRWYRVFVGEYQTVAEADKAGQKFRLEHVIDSFIVAKVTP